MRCVIIESPFAARRNHWWPAWDRWQNRRYLRRCIADSLRRGEAPFASHGFYPGILDDNKATERLLSMTAGWEWSKKADCVVVYTDRGISPGMLLGVKQARKHGIKVEQRFLEKPLAQQPSLG